jgi:putative phosphoesterase
MLIGLISDTHGLLRPEARAALRGSDLIIHAGDIGAPGVIDELRAMAPTFSVRGNNDTQAWAASVPERQIVDAAGRQILVLHQIGDLFREPAPAGCAAVVFGHTHKPLVETRNDVLYVNPGSAGPRRFKLPVTVGHLRIARDGLHAEIVALIA